MILSSNLYYINVSDYFQADNLIVYFALQVYPPPFQELPSPFLELFDLDSVFDSEKSSLAHLATNCLEAQSGENTIEENVNKFINRVNDKLEIFNHGGDCKKIIETVFLLINNYKKQPH